MIRNFVTVGMSNNHFVLVITSTSLPSTTSVFLPGQTSKTRAAPAGLDDMKWIPFRRICSFTLSSCFSSCSIPPRRFAILFFHRGNIRSIA